MQELKQSIAQEQPHIAAVLEKHLAELPPTARPVASHVLAAGGKRLRPLLTLLAGRCLGCANPHLYTLGAAIEILHAATLLHDDILDNAGLRRGQPTAHTIYGSTPVILAGDAMLAKALLMVSSLGDARLTKCISEAVMRTAEGQMAEFAHLRDTDLPHQGYLEIITGKTAWMLRASCELGALLAGAGAPQVDAAASFGLELGIAFQMVDDALDFSPAKDTGKPSGGDVKEGKITPPLLMYIESLPSEKRAGFKTRFREGAFTDGELESVCAAIFSEGCARKTRDMADTHLEKAAKSLKLLPESHERIVLEQMMLYIQHRDQ